MTRARWLLVIFVTLLAFGASWLWWTRPRQVNMTIHAPANSLVYLEANDPLEVVQALQRTDAWKVFADLLGTQQNAARNGWLQQFVGLTGIGPVESVILARAQVAVVVTDLGATEDLETLRVRPEGALIIETKTGERRIRPVVEKAVKKLAELTYGEPLSRTTTIDGIEFIEWVAPEGDRQIVATITGSLVIIGNTRQAVQTCLAVSQGRQPSLSQDPELIRMRSELGGANALSFGYVPASNSARLLSLGLPLLMGRAPANSELQRLTMSAASKVLGSVGWSSRPLMSGIEDRFLIALQPSITARLKPGFIPIGLNPQLQQIIPDDVHSIAFYKFENAAGTWQALKSSVSSQIDALSAIVFTSILNSSLSSYGIQDPERFLTTVASEIVTLRMDQNAERSLLIARVNNQAGLRALLLETMRVKAAREEAGKVETLETADGEFSATFENGVIVMGSPTDVQRYKERFLNNTLRNDPNKQKRLTFFVPFTSSANIVSYADDRARVRNFVSAVLAANGSGPIADGRLDQKLDGLPFSATETTLSERGLERRTLSPMGQFSTLFPLLIPAKRAPVNP